MTRQSLIRCALFCCLTVPTWDLEAIPWGSGFTYQGQIQESGAPVNGTVHLRFSLWDDEVDGTPVGASQTLTDIAVTEGLFTVVLNASEEFGPTAFNGEERWLQIERCEDGSCDSPTVLSPRQPLTATPYALNAQSAPWSGLSDIPEGFADNVDNSGDPLWGSNGNDISYTAGKVGIGSATPHHRLRISGGPTWTSNGWTGSLELDNAAAIGWQANNGGQRFGIGQSSGGLYFFNTTSDPGGATSEAQYAMAITDTGDVRIGTDDLDEDVKLNVVNNARFYTAIQGHAPDIGIGVVGRGFRGVQGQTDHSGGQGIYGYSNHTEGLAGLFIGNVQVEGVFTDLKSTFQIDHPLDPENKILTHSAVEAPEMKNIYDGNVITDATGYAKIVLPDYFEALNTDFRYQLTVVDEANSGDFVQAKVVKRIKANQFTIRTSRPKVEVSWLVTGVRQDAFAKANPTVVEREKSEAERGKYLTPEVFGQPKEMGIHYRPELEVETVKAPTDAKLEETK